MIDSTNPPPPNAYESEGDAVEALWLAGEAVSDIAEQTDVPEYQVRILMAQRGHDIADRNRKNQKYLAPLYEALEQGMTVKEAAAQIGQPYQSVLRWLRNDGYDTQTNYRAKYVRLMPQVRSRYAEGASLVEMGKALDVTPVTLSRWLKADGVDVRAAKPKTGAASKHGQHWDEVRRLHGEGQSNVEIAREVGISADTVRIWLLEAGLSPNRSESIERQQKTVQQQMLRSQAVDYYLAGNTYQATADHFGVNRSTVYSWVARDGKVGYGGRSVEDASLSREAVRLYVQEGKSIEEIQSIVGRGFYVVRGWLDLANVEVLSTWDRKTPEQRQALSEAARRANLGRRRGRKTRR